MTQFTHALNTVRHALMKLPAQYARSLIVVLMVLVVAYQLVLMASPQSIQHLSQGPPKRDASSVSSASKNGDLLLVLDRDMATSSHYKFLLDKYPDTFPSMSLGQKCTTYFDELYRLNEDWEVMDTQKDPDKDYKSEVLNKEKYMKNRIQKFKDEHEGKSPSEGDQAGFENDYTSTLSKTLRTEQNMVDAVTHLRVYGQCYLRERSSVIDGLFGGETAPRSFIGDGSIDLCYDVEQRLFPWISREFPTFKRWDGTTIKGIPDMSKYVDYSDDIGRGWSQKASSPSFSHGRAHGRSDCFMDTWRSSLNGQGLVFSVADGFLNDIIGIIRLLRTQGNKLPIQLVHKGDLSEDAQRKVIDAARTKEVMVPLNSYDKVKGSMKIFNTPQEVWFVNAQRCIRREYRSHFDGYANKLIAYMFNSFDDILLMDSDAVPFVKPSHLFNMGPYRRTGTLFFKDRWAEEKVHKTDTDFFHKLMPNSIDEALFQIPKVSNYTLENRYMKSQYKHLMEAGIVGMKRSKHFIGLLTSIQLNFWSATTSRIHGDKELFWLGQSIAGKEYEFNKYDVVSAGELTPLEDRPRNVISHEVCSTHPGHLSGDDDHTLLWVNSGMKYCKRESWDSDLSLDRYNKRYETAQELKRLFLGPVKINTALLPPGADRVKANGFDEPKQGWQIDQACQWYLWCAYDIIGASTDPMDRGLLIEYDNKTQARIEYYGKLWLNQGVVQLKNYEIELIKDTQARRLEEIQLKKEKAEKKAKAERERREKARKLKEEKERQERERLEKEEKERKDKERQERERLEKEEKERKDKERQERERLEKEEEERKEKEQKEKEQREKEQMEQEPRDDEQLEKQQEQEKLEEQSKLFEDLLQ